MVVTRESDTETREVCRDHSIECLLTEDMHRQQGEFHKAKGINRGLSQLQGNDWLLHFDADIVLPFDLHRLCWTRPFCVWRCIIGRRLNVLRALAGRRHVRDHRRLNARDLFS